MIDPWFVWDLRGLDGIRPEAASVGAAADGIGAAGVSASAAAGGGVGNPGTRFKSPASGLELILPR